MQSSTHTENVCVVLRPSFGKRANKQAAAIMAARLRSGERKRVQQPFYLIFGHYSIRTAWVW